MLVVSTEESFIHKSDSKYPHMLDDKIQVPYLICIIIKITQQSMGNKWTKTSQVTSHLPATLDMFAYSFILLTFAFDKIAVINFIMLNIKFTQFIFLY